MRIVRLYDDLAGLTGSPIVALTRAIARPRVSGPQSVIPEVEALASDPALASYHLVPAALAELWRAAGDPARAAEYYRAALALAGLGPGRRFLTARLQGL